LPSAWWALPFAAATCALPACGAGASSPAATSVDVSAVSPAATFDIEFPDVTFTIQFQPHPYAAGWGLDVRVTARGRPGTFIRFGGEPAPHFSGAVAGTRGDSQAKRSIFVEDFVYSFAPDALKVNRLDALGDDLVVIPLTEPSVASVALPRAELTRPAGR
jgi:hypothetical protein